MFVLKKAIFAHILAFMNPESGQSLILRKISKYCAQRERSEKEVREKLLIMGANPDEISDIIHLLKNENLINEERFVSAFIHDKFGHSGWGKNKIFQALEFHDIRIEVIQKGLDAIPWDDYRNTAIRHIKNTLKNANIVSVMVNKGFEEDLIVDLIHKQLKL